MRSSLALLEFQSLGHFTLAISNGYGVEMTATCFQKATASCRHPEASRRFCSTVATYAAALGAHSTMTGALLQQMAAAAVTGVKRWRTKSCSQWGPVGTMSKLRKDKKMGYRSRRIKDIKRIQKISKPQDDSDYCQVQVQFA